LARVVSVSGEGRIRVGDSVEVLEAAGAKPEAAPAS
jgi:hypothetical protein